MRTGTITVVLKVNSSSKIDMSLGCLVILIGKTPANKQKTKENESARVLYRSFHCVPPTLASLTIDDGNNNNQMMS